MRRFASSTDDPCCRGFLHLCSLFHRARAEWTHLPFASQYGVVENDGSRTRKAARMAAAASNAGIRRTVELIRKMRGFVSSA